MKERHSRVFMLAAAGAFLVCACEGDDRKSFGDLCASGWECDTGLCIHFSFYEPSNYCSTSCSIDAECPGDWVCAVMPSCDKYCAPPCGEAPHVIVSGSDYLCAGGVPVRCDLVDPGTYCDYCPCP